MSDSQKAKAHLIGKDARTVVRCMKPEWAYPMRIVAIDAGMSVAAVRRKMKLLKNVGLVSLGPIYNEDNGLIYGSGYCLTIEGEAMQDFLSKEGRDL